MYSAREQLTSPWPRTRQEHPHLRLPGLRGSV